MSTLKFYILLFLMFLVRLEIYAQPQVEFNRSDQMVSITYLSKYYVDTLGNSSITEISKYLENNQFSSANSDMVNFSAADSVLWFYCPIRNNTQSPVYLSYGNQSTVWYSEVYFKDSLDQFAKVFDYEHSEKIIHPIQLPFHTMAIQLPTNNEYQEILIRIKAQYPRNYNLLVGGLTPMSRYLSYKEHVPLIFMAFMLGILIYNCFLYFSTKEIIYLPYIIYLAYITFALPFHSGFPILKYKWLWEYDLIWTGLGYWSPMVFAFLYLNMKQTAPYFRIWIIGITCMLTLLLPFLFFTNLADMGDITPWNFMLSFVYNISLFVSGVYVWIKGMKNARFYVLGWFFVVSSMIIYILSLSGVMEQNMMTENIIYFGFAAEAVLFAIALGDRMNILKKEKNKILSDHLGLVRDQNKMLATQAFMNSHVLRTPLSRIMGLVNLLKKNWSGKEDKELIELIENSTDEMDDITRKISSMLETNGYFDQYQSDFQDVQKDIYKKMNGKESLK